MSAVQAKEGRLGALAEVMVKADKRLESARAEVVAAESEERDAMAVYTSSRSPGDWAKVKKARERIEQARAIISTEERAAEQAKGAYEAERLSVSIAEASDVELFKVLDPKLDRLVALAAEMRQIIGSIGPDLKGHNERVYTLGCLANTGRPSKIKLPATVRKVEPWHVRARFSARMQGAQLPPYDMRALGSLSDWVG